MSSLPLPQPDPLAGRITGVAGSVPGSAAGPVAGAGEAVVAGGGGDGACWAKAGAAAMRVAMIAGAHPRKAMVLSLQTVGPSMRPNRRAPKGKTRVRYGRSCAQSQGRVKLPRRSVTAASSQPGARDSFATSPRFLSSTTSVTWLPQPSSAAS